jgi:hypothetical protein
MPKQSYSLVAGGPKRLELSWQGLWRHLTVILDGRVIGTFPDQKALSAGQVFKLPDGSPLKIQLVRKYGSTELQVQRNDLPLPGSSSDPQVRLKTAYWMIFFIAGLNLVLGVLAWFFNIQALLQIGFGFGSVLFGLVFLLLGFLVQRKRSYFALILAIVLLFVDGIVGMVLSTLQGYSPSVGGFIGRIILMIPMIQGLGALNYLKRQDAK